MTRILENFVLVIISFMGVFYLSCSSKKAIGQELDVHKVAAMHLKGPISLVYNSDSTYVLCLGDGNSMSNPLQKSFCVVDKLSNLVFIRKMIHGNVSWYDTNTLKLEELPRVIHKGGDAEAVIKYLNIKEVDASVIEKI